MERVTLNELIAATGGRPPACDPISLGFDRIATDSRTVRPGDLFWAIKGERLDGHAFVAEAARRGAAACVVAEGSRIPGGVRAVIVADTQRALWDLARWRRGQLDSLVIGVTGSVGKTTTREMIHSVLSAGFEGVRSERNFNNHIGLPLSVLAIERRHDFAVLEIGASHVGEIRDLAAIAAPEVGVVTQVGIAHLETFGNVEAILEAKGELIEALPPSGFAVLNGDDPRCRSLARRAKCRVIEVGRHIGNTFRATAVEAAVNDLRFQVEGSSYSVRAAGRHHLTAALAAIAIGQEVGLSSRQIADGLANFVPADGRCQVCTVEPWTVIDDTYNANPNSMEAACELVHDWRTTGRRILVLGDMAELGDQSAAWHRGVGRTAARMGIDRLAAMGSHAADVVGEAFRDGMGLDRLAQCEDLDVLLAVLDCWIEPGDVVLVKGSRCMRMERVTDWLVQRSEIAKEIKNPRGVTRACA